MKSETFRKGLEEEMLLKLESPSIIVMDESVNRLETQYSYTVNWLSQHGVNFSNSHSRNKLSQ